MQIVVRITPTAIAVVIPQQSIVLVGQHKRHTHLGVILEQVFVQSLHVQLLRLMLSETIESLLFGTVEKHTPRKTVTLFLRHLCHINTDFTVWHTESLESLAIPCLFQQRMTLAIKEFNSARFLVDAGFYVGSLHRNHIAVRHRKLRFGGLLHNHQALFLWQLAPGGCLYPENMVADYLQAYHLGTSCLSLLDGNRHILSLYGIVISLYYCCDCRQEPHYDSP